MSVTRERHKSHPATVMAESRLTVNGMAALLLVLAWVTITVASLMLDHALSPRFLDLPLGAFLAGQGALVGLVIVGVRISRHGRTED